MPPSTDFHEKHVVEDKSIEQEEELEESSSRPSTVNHEDDVRNENAGPRTRDLEQVRSNMQSKRETPLDPLTPTITTESALPPPPDGGLHAWLKVFGGFMIYINIWFVFRSLIVQANGHRMLTSCRGFTLSFGAFQSYYKTDLLSSSSPSAISWIGTIQGFLLIVIGTLSGPLFDLGYFRPMLFVGNFLVVFGIMMLSLAKEYWQVLLSQGICMGLGAGLLYIPSLALVGVWFSKKRALAMGIVTSGIAVGEF